MSPGNLAEVANILAQQIISFPDAANETGVSLSAIRKYERTGELARVGVTILNASKHKFLFRSQLPKVRQLRDGGVRERVRASARSRG